MLEIRNDCLVFEPCATVVLICALYCFLSLFYHGNISLRHVKFRAALEAVSLEAWVVVKKNGMSTIALVKATATCFKKAKKEHSA